MAFFQLVPPDLKINFIGQFKYFFIFSIVALVAVVAGVLTKGLNYGVDFTGGTVIQVKFASPQKAEEVRRLVTEAGEPDASVVAMGKENTEYLITARNRADVKEATPLSKRLQEKAGGPAHMTIQSLDVVGPKVGAELKMAAIRSLIYAIILITIYIWLRFDFRFAPGATVAMIHDLIMAVGFYLISGNEFTITAVAALLTIAGYSVNDTIVIYDRVREMYKVGGEGLSLPETINTAINATLSRTLLTAGITLLSVLPIVLFCTGEIRDFAIAMTFGIFVGAYSTMYIASPMTIYIERFMQKRGMTSSHRPRPIVTT